MSSDTPVDSSTLEPRVTLITGADRLSQREQIAVHLARAVAREEPLRVRMPFTLYDAQSESRGYVPLRDAAWNLQLPSDSSPESVVRLIQTLGSCIAAIADLGSEEVLARLGMSMDTD
jgi:hypothetical protein